MVTNYCSECKHMEYNTVLDIYQKCYGEGKHNIYTGEPIWNYLENVRDYGRITHCPYYAKKVTFWRRLKHVWFKITFRKKKN
jgi:hypothetical protein